MILFFVALRLAFALIISIASIFASILLATLLYKIGFKTKDRSILKSFVCYLISFNIPIGFICYLLRIGMPYNENLVSFSRIYLFRLTPIFVIIYAILICISLIVKTRKQA